MCDIGGSTGRLAYELHQQLGAIEEIVVVERSKTFCQWSRRLLAGESFDWWVPVPDVPGRADFRLIDSAVRPKLSPLSGVHVYDVAGEQTPRPRHYFDLVTCLNVIDRTPAPRKFVAAIADLVQPTGLLVLGTPFDYREEFTPRSEWVVDLAATLPAGWEEAGRQEVAYVLMFHRWRFPAYVCQVLCARRVASPSAAP